MKKEDLKKSMHCEEINVEIFDDEKYTFEIIKV